jgi:hypothetical protein
MQIQQIKAIESPEDTQFLSKAAHRKMQDEVIQPFQLLRFSEYYEFYLNEAVPENQLGDKVWTTKLGRNQDGKLAFKPVKPSDYSSKLCFCTKEQVLNSEMVFCDNCWYWYDYECEDYKAPEKGEENKMEVDQENNSRYVCKQCT